MNFVKRKGTKAAKKLPAEFETVRADYVARVRKAVSDYSIPPELVLNLDETGLHIVPISNWTLDIKGSKQVAITGIDNKRQITVVVVCTASGHLLCPQVLYQGTTHRCHPNDKFPDGWDGYHSASHWSAKDTVMRLIDTILVPYVNKIKQDLGLPETQKALLVLDVFI